MPGAVGLADIEPRLEQAFGGGQPGLHITLELIKSQGKYVPGDEPKYITDPGAAAAALLRPAQPQVPFPGVQIRRCVDGAAYSPPQSLPDADRAAYNASGVGSPAESRLIDCADLGPVRQRPGQGAGDRHPAGRRRSCAEAR